MSFSMVIRVGFFKWIQNQEMVAMQVCFLNLCILMNFEISHILVQNNTNFETNDQHQDCDFHSIIWCNF